MSDCGCGCTDCNDAMNWPIRFALASRLCSTALRIGALQLTAMRNGPLEGNLYVSLVKDNQGVPSTDKNDVVFKSEPQSISDFKMDEGGLLEVTVNADVQPNQLYHVVIEADDKYRESGTQNKTAAWLKSTTKTVSPCVFDGDGWTNTSIGPIVKVVARDN